MQTRYQISLESRLALCPWFLTYIDKILCNNKDNESGNFQNHTLSVSTYGVGVNGHYVSAFILRSTSTQWVRNSNRTIICLQSRNLGSLGRPKEMTFSLVRKIYAWKYIKFHSFIWTDQFRLTSQKRRIKYNDVLANRHIKPKLFAPAPLWVIEQANWMACDSDVRRITWQFCLTEYYI